MRPSHGQVATTKEMTMDDPGWGQPESGPLPGSDTVAFEPRARVRFPLKGRRWMLAVAAFVVGGALGTVTTYHVTSKGDQPTATPVRTTVTVTAPGPANAALAPQPKGICDFARQGTFGSVASINRPRAAPPPATDGGVDMTSRGFVAHAPGRHALGAGAPCPSTA